jgi:DoxX-like family
MNAVAVSAVSEGYLMETPTAQISKSRIWTSRVLQILAILFLLMDGVMKLIKPPVVVQSTVGLGYAESAIVPIGVAVLVCSLLYVIPRTAILGAILLTGYLGGAVASNVRAATPLFNAVFPFLFAVLIWAPLVLRNKQLESVLFKGK